MSLKLEIETWVAALARYDNNEFDDAIVEFEKISDTSKILFNMGVIHATLGEHEKAVECYQRAIRLDQYLAVAYFQQGVSNFLLGDFEEALANFNDSLLYLRGNSIIDYAQLGLLFKLYSCEILFNRGLCSMYLQRRDAGMQDLMYAAKEKVVADHDVIDEAIAEQAEGYTVFSIPVGVVYRPNEAKVRNLKTKDYLGKARLVAASDRSNAFTGFAGSEIRNAARAEGTLDRPAGSISFAATNLVKPGIQSRRLPLQPESAVGWAGFPPTPPPENERLRARGSSRTGSRPVPTKLTLKTQESNRRYEKAPSPEEGHGTRPTSHTSSSSRGFSNRWNPTLVECSSTGRIDEEDEEDPADLYDVYQGRGGSPPSAVSPSTQPRQLSRNLLDKDDEVSDYDGGSSRGLGGEDFEMISSDRRAQSSRSTSRAPSRRPEICKVHVKVHADDVRYITIGTATQFPDFVDCIKEKFAMRRRFKIKIQDEDMPGGEMITLGDQDDLEMAIQSSTDLAKRQGQDVAKMEIWIFELDMYNNTRMVGHASGKDLHRQDFPLTSYPYEMRRGL